VQNRIKRIEHKKREENVPTMGDGESASPVTQPEMSMGDGEGGRRRRGR
jgi:hypothetical protein